MRAAEEILYVNVLLLSFTEDDIFQSAIPSWPSQKSGASGGEDSRFSPGRAKGSIVPTIFPTADWPNVVNHVNLHYRQFQMMPVTY